jgi:4-hydroxy-3-polyprenylbenzoate decarboxylase
MAERIVPGLCIDTHIPMGMTDWGGVIFQVKKRRARDEGLHRNILTAALSISLGARLGIVVDEDVDIYNMEDILWAITTRVNPNEDLLTICEGGFGQTFQPAERSSAGDRQWTQSNIRFSGALGIDATRPFVHKDAFARARYNVELVDLAKFYSAEQIRRGKAGQRDYAKFLAERGI